MPESSLDLVDLLLAKSPFEAQVLVGVLEDAGIFAHVEGSACGSSFLDGTHHTDCVQLRVPRALLGPAQAALASARESSRLLRDDAEIAI